MRCSWPNVKTRFAVPYDETFVCNVFKAGISMRDWESPSKSSNWQYTFFHIQLDGWEETDYVCEVKTYI